MDSQPNMTSTSPQKTTQPDNIVHLPKYVVTFVSGLLTVIIAGVLITIFFTVFWLFILSVGQNNLKREVEAGKQQIKDSVEQVDKTVKKIRTEQKKIIPPEENK